MFYFSQDALSIFGEGDCGPDRVVVTGRLDSYKVKNGWVYAVTCNVPGPAYCCILVDVE